MSVKSGPGQQSYLFFLNAKKKNKLEKEITEQNFKIFRIHTEKVPNEIANPWNPERVLNLKSLV